MLKVSNQGSNVNCSTTLQSTAIGPAICKGGWLPSPMLHITFPSILEGCANTSCTMLHVQICTHGCGHSRWLQHGKEYSTALGFKNGRLYWEKQCACRRQS